MELVIDMCRYFQNEINKVGASNMLLISTNTLLLCSYVEMVPPPLLGKSYVMGISG